MKKLTLTAALLVFVAALTSACFEENMQFLTPKIELAANPNIAEWIPRLAYNSKNKEFLVVWTELGVRAEGETSKYVIVAQRLSSEGEKKGEAFMPAGEPMGNIIILPTPEYDVFKNRYLVAYTRSGVAFDQYAAIFGRDGTVVAPSFAVSQQPGSQMHSRLAYNRKRRQFFLVYNSSESGSPDVKGIILDENGIPVTSELLINDAPGDQYNPYIVYNPKNDTYLVNWEDFRNVPTWEDNGEIYGALLDGDGSILVNDIAMIDDFGQADEGDQRLNEISYNPDRNEFLATWSDTSPSLDEAGVRGVFITAEGKLAGSVFTVVDGAGPQIFQHTIYSSRHRKYFILWEDGRNQVSPGSSWFNLSESDIYGAWLSANGEELGDEIVFCDEPGIQRYSSLAYSEETDRLLATWQEIIDEDLHLGETDNQTGQHVMEAGGNVYAILYGKP